MRISVFRPSLYVVQNGTGISPKIASKPGETVEWSWMDSIQIANHFCEWTYDYTVKKYPNFSFTPSAVRILEQQVCFFEEEISTQLFH